ncbi:hypothetical protein JKP88DRAFT_205172 [Tribonema minus]|uniref:Uncharacterized protein n=1 Tax=Tribonema minus TaxID=303371 RepID=A0A835ZD18_9STRA|nr:hypothetical protein JKP88DRAFT_205172 [Tribonema minus]
MKGALACTALLATLLSARAAPGGMAITLAPQPTQPIEPLLPMQPAPQVPLAPAVPPQVPPAAPVAPVAPVVPPQVPVAPVAPPPVVPAVPPAPLKPFLLPNGSIDFVNLPPWTRCEQGVKPPGVKPGACLQVMCMPKSVQPGDTFHITIRFCLQRPRRWHLAFGLLDLNSKQYYGGAGAGVLDTRAQCGEVTFEHTFDAKKSPGLGIFDLMWKFYIVPNHGMDGFYVEDTFPNMLGEAGVDQQPNYLAPLDKKMDCPNKEMQQWNLPPTGFQNGIEYTIIPKCFQPGQPWFVLVDTHLETMDEADLHCNLQIGSGGDVYLGPEDQYVTETNVYNLQANPKTGSWASVPPGYWTTHPILFTAAQTALVQPDTPVYLACFMVPPGAAYNPGFPEGWFFLDREFYLNMQFCDADPFQDINGDGILDVPTDFDLNGDGTVDGQPPQPNPNYIDLNGDGIAAEQDHNGDGIQDVDLNLDGIVDDLNGDGVIDMDPPVVYGPEGDAVAPPVGGTVSGTSSSDTGAADTGSSDTNDDGNGNGGNGGGGGQQYANGVTIDDQGNLTVDANNDGVDDRRDGIFTDVNKNGIDDSDEAAAAARAAENAGQGDGNGGNGDGGDNNGGNGDGGNNNGGGNDGDNGNGGNNNGDNGNGGKDKKNGGDGGGGGQDPQAQGANDGGGNGGSSSSSGSGSDGGGGGGGKQRRLARYI